MTDLIIDRLIYRRMRDSERIWRTPVEVKKGRKEIESKKDAIAVLYDRKEWKKRTEGGEAKRVQNLQKIGTNMLDPSWVGQDWNT